MGTTKSSSVRLDTDPDNSSKQPVFHLKNLSCTYPGSETGRVLYVEDLRLERGKVIFLLGASGVGKSTLLETLGLMNHTISEGELWFHPGTHENATEINGLWSSANEKSLAEIRKQFFSFVFQYTNLMDNFTAYENVCLARMIQQDQSLGAGITEVGDIMNEMGLGMVDPDTLPTRLSGGQRQRLAFVRALNSRFSVLFGDEPTGNLDEALAHTLMELLKKRLNPAQSAIIVSHDIDLAIGHADQIIGMTKAKDKAYGEILQKNIWERAEWTHLKGEGKERFRQKLNQLYAADTVSTSGSPNAADSTDVYTANKATYKRLFLKKEGLSMEGGRKRSNLWILSALMFFTFLAIGFANGSYTYLNKS